MADQVYLKNLDTGRVSAFTAAEAMLKEKAGTHARITREEYQEARDAEGQSFSIGAATSRVVHIRTSESTFRGFRQRCASEGIGVDEALSELMLQYSRGAVLTHVSHHKKPRSGGADYLADHGKES